VSIMESAILERPGTHSHPAQSAAGEPGEDASAAVEKVYACGLRLLAEILAREALLPEPTVESLRKYFPPLRGVLPPGLPPEHADDWRDRIEYYRGLILQLGCSHRPPRSLLNAVRMWERGECGRAAGLSVPRSQWRQKALAEWMQIRDASRARRPKGKPKSSSPEPPLLRAQDHSTAGLWAPPDPELTNEGLAAEPEYVFERLQNDPAYAQRYMQIIGEASGHGDDEEPRFDDDHVGVDVPDEPDAPVATAEVPIVGSARFVAALTRRLAAESMDAPEREPEYPQLPGWFRA